MTTVETETATFELGGESKTGPLEAIGWLVFTVLFLVAPVVVWATWGALL